MSDHSEISEISMPGVVEHTVDLDVRPTLGLARAIERRLRGQVSLGWIEAVWLNPDNPALSPGLRAYLAQSAPEHTFHLIDLRCSFRPDAVTFEEATLSVAVERTDGVAERVPLIWSMTPKRLITPVQVRRSRSISPNVTLIPEIAELGLGAEIENSYQREDLCLYAAGEREETAEWRFRRTPTVELAGVHQLTLLLRNPTYAITRLSIDLSAKARLALGGVIPYRAISSPENPRELLIAPPVHG